MDENDIANAWEDPADTSGTEDQGTALKRHPVPAHVEELYDQALQNCHTSAENACMRQLLNRFQDVFSKDEDDMGRTDLIAHEVHIKKGNRPLRQTARRLGPEKERSIARYRR